MCEVEIVVYVVDAVDLTPAEAFALGATRTLLGVLTTQGIKATAHVLEQRWSTIEPSDRRIS